MDLQPVLPQLNDSNSSYTFASPRPQHFSFRFPIIKYIFTNPSSGILWEKLIKSCKYFFSKSPIYPVVSLQYDCNDELQVDGQIFDSTENFSKLWIHFDIEVINHTSTFLSSLIPKIDKCNLHYLRICEQRLTYAEYRFLTLSGDLKSLHFISCTISHPDGTLVAFDQLFENIHKLEFFQMECAENSSSMFKKDTFKKLADILPHLKELSNFILDDLTEAFEFATITDFIMKNESFYFRLYYNNNQLSDAYKEILESLIAKIIETPPKRIPDIKFPGFENSVFYDDYQKLYNLRK